MTIVSLPAYKGVIQEESSSGKRRGKGTIERRPYLTQELRQQLWMLSRSELLRYFHPGELLHVDMDPEEAVWINKFSGSKMRHTSNKYEQIAKELDGRTAEDVEAFRKDFLAGRVNSSPICIILDEDNVLMTPPQAQPVVPTMRRKQKRTTYLMDRTLNGHSWAALNDQAHGGFKEVCNWYGCSGSVIQMATPSRGVLPNGLYTCLVGSATETDPSRQRPGLQDPYNRQGELVGIQLDTQSARCKVLDGHCLTQDDGRVMRSTVTCVVHSDNNSAYVSGGYDGNIAVWSDDKLGLLSRFGSHAATINSLAADSKSYGIVYGTGKGELIWCADPLAPRPDGGGPKLHSLCGPRAVEGQRMPLANSLDVLILSSRGRSKTIAYAGYGYLTGLKSGAVNTYDLESLQAGGSYKLEHEKSLTDMALHPQENLLAVATGILVDDKGSNGDGKIRMFDVRAPGCPMMIETEQNDMHRLAFSPSGDLIYSCDASSGMMLLHDLRIPSRPIWSHGHSSPKASEHFMGFGWMPKDVVGLPTDILLTGGNDNTVKMWDVRRPETLLESYDIGQPVNNIAVSQDGCQIFVGTEYGSIHVLSRNVSLAEGLGQNLLVSFDPNRA